MKKRKLKLALTAALLAALCAQSVLGGVLVRAFYDNNFAGLPADADGIDPVVNAADFDRNNIAGLFTETLTEHFDNRQNGINSDDGIDLFGSLVRGFIEAPQTGTYTVVVSSDDDSELYLNTSETPHEVIDFRDPDYLIGFESDWTNGDPFTAARFDQRSSVVELEKGVKYYVELIHREGTGGSFINVSWERPDGVRETVPGVSIAPLGNTFDPFNPATSTELVEQPVDVTVSESEEALFWVTAHAPQPAEYQWMEDGSPIDGANLSWYSIPEAQLGQSGNSYSVQITANGQTTTSSAATLTVTADSTDPTVVSVKGSGNPHGLIVEYSEKVTEASATNTSNYSITGQDLTVAGATMLSTSSVLLDVGEFSDDSISLSISGIRDRSSSANQIAATSFDVNFNPSGATYLFYEYTGGGLAGFYAAPRGMGQYPDNFNRVDPSVQGNAGEGFANRVSSSTPYLEVPNSGDIDTTPPADVANNYGLVIFGYVVPQETANYYFYLAVDDNAELYVSTNEDPANTSLIAREPQWNAVREWNGTADNAATAEDETNINHSDAVSLQAGQRYYFEVVSQEGGGGDNVAVAWNTSGNPPANGDPPISGEFLQQAVSAGPLSIVTQPVDQAGVEGRPITFSIEVEGSDPLAVGYQWYRDGNPIIGANNSTYTLDPVQLSDNGAVFHVEAFNTNGTFNRVVSDDAAINVDTDVFPPEVVSLDSTPFLQNVLIVFDEAVEPDAATDPNTYTITAASGGAELAVSEASLSADGLTVNLSTDTQTEGTKYFLEISGLSDLAATQNMLNGTFSFVSFARQQGGLTALFYETTGGGLGFYPAPRGQGNPPEGWNPFGVQTTAGNATLVANRMSSITPYFESPSANNGDITANPGDQADNYSQVVFGWLRPEVSGTYRFYLSTDDQAELYLSTNDDPASSQHIATENNWTGWRTWLNREPADDGLNDGATGTTSDPIQLQAGQFYYVEMIQSEGGGGDRAAVAWSFTTDGSDPARPANGSSVIPGEFLYSNLPVFDEVTVSASEPAGDATGVFIDTDSVSMTLTDGVSNKVDPDSVTATLGGQSITVDVQKSGDDTMISASLPELLPPNTTLDLVVSFNTLDGEAQQITQSFMTENIATLNPGWRTANGTGTGSGFTARTEQAPAGSALANTYDRAELQLTGDPASSFSGGPVELDVINLNQDTDTNQGIVTPDTTFSSVGLMDGDATGGVVNGNTDEITGEFITYLEFPEPGIYFMGVNSDDGFRITSGLNPVPDSEAAPGDIVEVGGFNTGRGANAATPQSPARVIVDEAGLYAFRMIWFEGTGGASVEWTIQNPDGDWVLVNSEDSQVKAYTGRSTEPGGTVGGDGATLSVADNGDGSLTISWDPAGGTLQWAPAVTGPWEDVAGATSPHNSAIEAGDKFYRVVQ